MAQQVGGNAVDPGPRGGGAYEAGRTLHRGVYRALAPGLAATALVVITGDHPSHPSPLPAFRI